jgi:predicted Zn-dependent peptidase
MLSRHVVVLALLAMCAPAAASTEPTGQYRPMGLYDAEHVTLANGLKVILKPRSGARTASVRLVVDVGFADFPCGKQETPHFLEHLLFAGTRQHDESELDSLVESHGGYWNATAGVDTTTYEVDIFSGHSDLAITLLHEIMTDSTLSNEDIEIVRDIIHREMGGRPSALRQWLYQRGIGKHGFDKALEATFPKSHFSCKGLETAEGIDKREIVTAFDTYYVSENMTLVVVGDFIRDEMMGLIRETFGQLDARAAPDRIDTVEEDYFAGGGQFSSTLSPIIDSEANVGIAFPRPGRDSDDRFSLAVLAQYLHKRLYDELRVNRGLAYAPEIDQLIYRKFGVLVAETDVDTNNLEEALSIIVRETERVVSEPPDRELFDETVRGLLLLIAQGYESNSAISDMYARNGHELFEHGAFIDRASAVEAVTPQEMHRVARLYLQSDDAAIVRAAPTLTYTQLFAGVGATGLIIVFMCMWYYVRRRRARHD